MNKDIEVNEMFSAFKSVYSVLFEFTQQAMELLKRFEEEANNMPHECAQAKEIIFDWEEFWEEFIAEDASFIPNYQKN